VKTKQIPKKQKSKTHFEVVPLTVVKKIAGGDLSKNGKAGTGQSSIEQVSASSDGAPARSI
jgi:hypothetical protein